MLTGSFYQLLKKAIDHLGALETKTKFRRTQYLELFHSLDKGMQYLDALEAAFNRWLLAGVDKQVCTPLHS